MVGFPNHKTNNSIFLLTPLNGVSRKIELFSFLTQTQTTTLLERAVGNLYK